MISAYTFFEYLKSAGITAVSEYLTVDEFKKLLDQGLSPREIEEHRIAQYENNMKINM